MTGLSQIINPRWLLRAEPDRATCADQVSAGSQTTNPPRTSVASSSKIWHVKVSSLGRAVIALFQ
jgi:hypothetical protein